MNLLPEVLFARLAHYCKEDYYEGERNIGE